MLSVDKDSESREEHKINPNLFLFPRRLLSSQSKDSESREEHKIKAKKVVFWGTFSKAIEHRIHFRWVNYPVFFIERKKYFLKSLAFCLKDVTFAD